MSKSQISLLRTSNQSGNLFQISDIREDTRADWISMMYGARINSCFNWVLRSHFINIQMQFQSKCQNVKNENFLMSQHLSLLSQGGYGQFNLEEALQLGSWEEAIRKEWAFIWKFQGPWNWLEQKLHGILEIYKKWQVLNPKLSCQLDSSGQGSQGLGRTSGRVAGAAANYVKEAPTLNTKMNQNLTSVNGITVRWYPNARGHWPEPSTPHNCCYSQFHRQLPSPSAIFLLSSISTCMFCDHAKLQHF